MSELESFHDVLFPTAVSFGATGGPQRRVEIVELTSGREKRNARAALSRRRYDVGTGLRSIDDLQDIVAFFEARRGSLCGFRFRDPLDRKSCRPHETPTPLDQPLGTGDGETGAFQLLKAYGEGDSAYLRPIARPLAGTVRIAANGVELSSPDDFAIDHATGIVSFTAPPGEGATLTAGYEFDVPVRFDLDAISVGIASFKAGQIPTIPLIELIASA